MSQNKILSNKRKNKDKLNEVNEKDENKKASNSVKIKSLMKNIKKTHSLRYIMSFLKIFRGMLNEDNNDKIVVDEGDLFNDIMQFSLTKLPAILKEILNLPEELKGFIIKNKKLEIMLKVYISNIYKFLSKLHDEEMIIFLLKMLPNICELIIITNKVLRIKFIKLFIELWSTNSSIVVKLNSFLLLRKIASMFPSDLEDILKKTYASFVKNSKSMNWRNYELVAFMINCYNELLSIDYNISYMVAFQYINQKAVMLKNYFKDKSSSNIHNIYNWQFLNSLKLWIRAIIAHSSELGELILPIIFICEGMLTLFSIPKYFPLFLHILAELNNISRSLGIYIPSMKTSIFSLLGSKEFFKKKSNKKPKAFDFDINIKVQKEYSVTNSFWNAAFNEILDLIVDFLSIHSRKIFFPELTHFIIFNLKKLQKKYTFNYYKMKIKTILQKIQDNKETILNDRKKVNISLTKKHECLNFGSKSQKTSLEEEYERIYEERENLRKQKIIAEKEEGDKEDSDEDKEDDGEEEGINFDDNEEHSQENHDDEEMNDDERDENYDNQCLEKPLSEEEDLDLE